MSKDSEKRQADTFEAQSGYVSIEGADKAASLYKTDGRLHLEVVDADGLVGFAHPPDIELAVFRGSRNAFTLLGLQYTGTRSRLGVGGLTTYAVRVALEDVVYTSPGEITGSTWILYVEDLAKIIHVTGLEETITLDGGMSINWFFRSAAPVTLRCPQADLQVVIGQDMKSGGDRITGPRISFRYPARVIFDEEQTLDAALKILNRIRLFFSLIMGRVLAIEEVSLRITGKHGKHDAKVHGLIPTQRGRKTVNRLVGFESPDELANMLDKWLARYADIKEAVHLHMDGLEQQTLPLQLRFQIFVQALEGLHRCTVSGGAAAIDVPAVQNVLRDLDISAEIIDRVGGVLAHAHELGLRQRLKGYWDQFAAEIVSLRPRLRKGEFVGRVVATRNHFAHRTEKDSQVLEGGDLWDHTETVKALSHMALLSEVGASTEGLGTAMVRSRFTEYTIAGDETSELVSTSSV